MRIGSPSACSAPSVTEVTADSVGLSWSPPRKDGGKPVTGYVVEKREVGTEKWVKATPGTINNTQATVRGLQTGKEYEFRVAPVNEVGVGEKSEPTEPVKVAPPPVAPKISTEYLPKEVNVRVGEPFKLAVPFTGGNPPPIPVITLNGVPINPDDERISVAITPENECVLTNKCAQRADTGRYVVQLKNDKGSDSTPIVVNVMDKPGAPEGPIRVGGVKPDSCTLSWNPPVVC